MTEHRRVQGSILAGIERRTLVWIAKRMPRVVHSDHLSLLGLLSVVAAGCGFATAQFFTRWHVVVVAALVANWFGSRSPV